MTASRRSHPRRVWIDLTNSPHVTFFRPILRRLDEAGVAWEVTARDFAQTVGLLQRFGIPHTVIGRHGGAGLAGKGVGLARRSLALLRYGRDRAFSQAVSHGSNDLAVAARLLGLHSTVLHDYEGAAGMHRVNFRLASKVMVPAVVPFEELRVLGLDERRYRPYAGIKEQVSLADFTPDDSVLAELGLDRGRTIVVLRPPATMSLYHRGLANTLFDRVLAHVVRSGAQAVVLPRTGDQAAGLRDMPGILVPGGAVDGPALVWAADVVVSAGGTMNREAAVLGVPTWTTFAGRLGAVDRMLVEQGRLRVASRPEDVVLERRVRTWRPPDAVADAVTEEILRGAGG